MCDLGGIGYKSTGWPHRVPHWFRPD